MVANNRNLEKLRQLIQQILNKITRTANLTPSTHNRPQNTIESLIDLMVLTQHILKRYPLLSVVHHNEKLSQIPQILNHLLILNQRVVEYHLLCYLQVTSRTLCVLELVTQFQHLVVETPEEGYRCIPVTLDCFYHALAGL